MKYSHVVELKNIIEKLVNEFTQVIEIHATNDTVKQVLGKEYREGMENIEVALNMNFFEERERLQFLESYVFDNIKNLNQYLKDQLRQELQRGLMNNESINQLKERVKKVMQIGADRARMIARTEANRAVNMGRLDAAKQSQLRVKKYVDATLDARTSDICRHMQKAYGKGTQAIGLDKKFKYKDNKGVIQEWDAPPFHPNCRTVVMFEQQGLTKEELGQ